jgi:hypothetical protein
MVTGSLSEKDAEDRRFILTDRRHPALPFRRRPALPS